MASNDDDIAYFALSRAPRARAPRRGARDNDNINGNVY